MKLDITLEELRALQPDLPPWNHVGGLYIWKHNSLWLMIRDKYRVGSWSTQDFEVVQCTSYEDATVLKQNLFDQLVPLWRIMKAAGK